jgi:predicted nucleic acid-binding protein
MKLMSDNIFVDSNILIYTYSNNNIHKQTIARSIIQNNNTVISTQVLQELTNVLTRKLNVSYSFIPDVISECCQNN